MPNIPTDRKQVEAWLKQIKQLQERIVRLEAVILQQEERINKQTRRIGLLTQMLHIPKDAEPVENKLDVTVTIVESVDPNDALADEVKKLPEGQEATHDGIEYYDEGI